MNIFQKAAIAQANFNAATAENGYKSFTTFYSDLTIADCFGIEAIKDTYNRVVRDWFDNTEYFTEFVMSLNYKCWEMYDKGNEALSRLYGDLFQQAQDKVYDEWDKEAADYYWRTTD